MKFEIGDEIVFIKSVDNCSRRVVGTVDAITGIREDAEKYGVWQVRLNKNLGCDFEHIRKLSKLEKALK